MFSGLEFLTYQSPEAVGLSRLPAKSVFFHFPDEKSAMQANCRHRGPYYMDLAGEWQFRYYESPKDVPDDPSLVRDWTTLPVPSCWDMLGYDHPHYTNRNTPWTAEEALAPKVIEKNPTGLYRRTFTLPACWEGKRVVLAFDGAETVVYATVNGHRVGFTKDSRTGAQFEITDKLVPGENTLDVIVVKWSDSDYIEDQDEWFHAGIVRPVYLYAMPETAIYDFFAAASLKNDYQDGVLDLEISATFQKKYTEGYRFSVRLSDMDGKEVLKGGVNVMEHSRKRGAKDFSRMESDLHLEVPGVHLWSSEDPYLYTLTITLLDPAGKVADAAGCRIGFKSVEIRDRSLLISGQKVLICGVNRHEHDPKGGRTLTMDRMEQDALLMKQYNVNAVRCSHYPPSWEFLEFCDQYGLYVMDETNLECHGYYFDLAYNPAWGPAFLDRAQKMVMRDKNHPSVFCWSLGNESGNGANHAAMAGWIRDYDKTRILHYEGCTQYWIPRNEMVKSDIISPMYPHIGAMIRWAENFADNDPRPMIMCEYSHAMGNSNGGLADYFKAFRRYPAIQGGFIWEWLDHGIYAKDGKTFLYGGDFGDVPNDMNFVADGLIWPDRIPHPALNEYKHLCQKIAFELPDPKSLLLRITNENYFTDLSRYDFSWEITVDGKKVSSGAITKDMMLESRFYMSCAIDDRVPGEKREDMFLEPVRRPFYKPCPGLYYSHEFHNTGLFRIPALLPECMPGQTVLLNVRAVLHEKCAWADKGHPVAWEQFELPAESFLELPAKTTAAVPVPGKDGAVAAGQTVMAPEGAFLRFNGKEIITETPAMNVMRAILDNDGVRWALKFHMTAKPIVRWDDKGLLNAKNSTSVSGPAVTDSGAGFCVRGSVSTEKVPGEITLEQKYLMDGNGVIHAEALFNVPEIFRDLPRLGMTYVLPGSFSEVEYFGRGPWENYIDRNASAMKGLYRTTVDEMYTPYIMPQDFGNRTDVKFFALYSREFDSTLLFKAPAGMEFSVSRYPQKMLDEAMHTSDLSDSGKVFLKVDYRQRGVGSVSCGPDANEEYRTQCGRFLLRFRIKVLSGKVPDLAEEAVRL